MNDLSIPVFLKPARNTSRPGTTPRLESVQKAAHACEPQGAVLADLIRITGFPKAILTTTVGQYVKRGYLFKAGPLMRQRYYVSECARDAGAEHIARDEEARKLEKLRAAQSGKERARQALLANIKLQADIAADKVERYHAAVVQAGSKGISSGELEVVFNVTRRATQRPMEKLRNAGRVWFVSVGRTLRYYSSEAFALAGSLAIEAENKARSDELYRIRQEKKDAKRRSITAAKPKAEKLPKEPRAKKVRETAKAKPAKRESLPGHMLVAKAAVRQPKKPTGPVEVIVPADVKVTRCPPMPDRFAVSGPVVGGFATMRLGQYLPADTWASRLVAA